MKLKENYGVTDDDLKIFYKDFAENLKTYQALNSEVVEILFGYTDFEKFK